MKQKAQATKDEMREEIERWATRIRVTPKRVQIQRMTTKWASCSTAGRVSFSTELLNESLEFREVVIVHELLHLVVPNHGKLFKSMMNAYLPGWDKIFNCRANRRCGHSRSD